MKRTRRDHGKIEEIVFELFERQPNWSLRNLIQETNQPEVCDLSSFTLISGFYEISPYLLNN